MRFESTVLANVNLYAKHTTGKTKQFLDSLVSLN